MFSNQRPFFSSRFGQFEPSSFAQNEIFPFVLEGLKRLERRALQMRPPEWLVQEVSARLILLLNHILLKEPQALERIKRQKARSIEVKWHHWVCRVQCTPAGLLELSRLELSQAQTSSLKAADLSIELMESSVLALMQILARGQKPPLHIQGDVQLAAELNWLVDHVRWDLEDDLAKLVGDVNAHQLGELVRYLRESMHKFVTLAQESLKRKKTSHASDEGLAS